MADSPREVVERHIRLLEERAAAAEVAADYAEDAKFEMNGSQAEGVEAITKLFENFIPMMGEMHMEEIQYTEHDDGCVEIAWKAGPMNGGDKFYCDPGSGLIKDQRAWMGVKPEDW